MSIPNGFGDPLLGALATMQDNLSRLQECLNEPLGDELSSVDGLLSIAQQILSPEGLLNKLLYSSGSEALTRISQEFQKKLNDFREYSENCLREEEKLKVLKIYDQNLRLYGIKLSHIKPEKQKAWQVQYKNIIIENLVYNSFYRMEETLKKNNNSLDDLKECSFQSLLDTTKERASRRASIAVQQMEDNNLSIKQNTEFLDKQPPILLFLKETDFKKGVDVKTMPRYGSEAKEQIKREERQARLRAQLHVRQFQKRMEEATIREKKRSVYGQLAFCAFLRAKGLDFAALPDEKLLSLSDEFTKLQATQKAAKVSASFVIEEIKSKAQSARKAVSRRGKGGKNKRRKKQTSKRVAKPAIPSVAEEVAKKGEPAQVADPVTKLGLQLNANNIEGNCSYHSRITRWFSADEACVRGFEDYDEDREEWVRQYAGLNDAEIREQIQLHNVPILPLMQDAKLLEEYSVPYTYKGATGRCFSVEKEVDGVKKSCLLHVAEGDVDHVLYHVMLTETDKISLKDIPREFPLPQERAEAEIAEGKEAAAYDEWIRSGKNKFDYNYEIDPKDNKIVLTVGQGSLRSVLRFSPLRSR